MVMVGSKGQTKWKRLSRMSGRELRLRFGQEASKWVDLALYRARLGPRLTLLQREAAAPANFFFGANSDEPLRRAALLRTHLPQAADAILLEANDICRHQFHLLGYEKLDFGETIDWHFDRVHGKRSPLRPWFTINFLDFHAVGDHKVIWELNRHQHLVTLAKAFLLTGNSLYATEIAAQFYSWQKANPYPLGINWASTLEVAFRSLSWLWVRNLLAGCAELPANFHTDILLSLQSHGRYIEKYLSTYFSPNTHLLGEAAALFFIGTMCPEISAAKRWREQGWRIVLEESAWQVRPDGVYFEQALYYHVYALDFFLHVRHLASVNGFNIPEQLDDIVKKMLDFLHSISECAPPEGFGDDDGGRVFDPRRNRTECMTDPLALGAVLYDCEKYARTGLTEEAIWLFGDKALQLLGRPLGPMTLPSKAFEAGGIYLINDDQPRVQQFMIDSGPQGTGNAGHGHADALSVRFSLDGQRFLIDPGTYCYISDDDARNKFRGTGAHNTLRVDGLDQAIPDGPFGWNSIPNVKVETWVNGRTFDFFVGSHDGYLRLPDPVLHRRFVFHVKGGLWVVRDVAEGSGNHFLETFWHFAGDLGVRAVDGMMVVESVPDSTLRDASLALLSDCGSGWNVKIAEGLISPAYGSKQVAPVVIASAEVTLPADCGFLLLPMPQSSEVGTFTAIGEPSARGVRGYRYQTAQSAEFLFFAQENFYPWTCGLWASDASFLYCKLERGRFAQVIMVSGSFGDWHGKRFVSCPSRPGIFEWTSRSESVAPEDSVIGDFEVFDPVS